MIYHKGWNWQNPSSLERFSCLFDVYSGFDVSDSDDAIGNTGGFEIGWPSDFEGRGDDRFGSVFACH